MAGQSCTLVREVFLRYSYTATTQGSGTRKGGWITLIGRDPFPISGSCAWSKANVMDTRTLLILGLGIAILLVLGFFALPA